MSTALDPNFDLAGHLRSAGATLVEVEHRAAERETVEFANGELRAVVVRALDDPLEFPPLARCTVPGDHVAIAVDETVPRLAEVVAGACEAFCRAGIVADEICVVTSDANGATWLEAELPAMDCTGPRVELHDPTDDSGLCYVGLKQNGEPLLVSRTLYEADVVFPIGCARLEDVLGSAGVYDSLYPRFADADTVRRWRMPESVQPERQAAWRQEADEAGWLLGAAMILEIVPGPRGTAARVVAGEARAVGRQSLELCRQLWTGHVARSASLVIATLPDEHEHQTWENVARAVGAAARVTGEHGALAICCQRLDPPGKSLQRLAAEDDRDDVLRKLTRDAEKDTWSAWQLAVAQQRGPVYLLGGLEAEAVEELGIAPVGDLAELARLASRHESCILLEDSHQLVATADG